MSDDFIAHNFIAHLHDLFAPLGEVSARRMFGGYGLYHDEVMIGVVMEDGLYLKTDDATQAQFETAGSAPFIYDSGGKRVTMSYWSAPEAAMDSPQAMLPWARLALEAALRKANSPAKRKSSKSVRKQTTSKRSADSSP